MLLYDFAARVQDIFDLTSDDITKHSKSDDEYFKVWLKARKTKRARTVYMGEKTFHRLKSYLQKYNLQGNDRLFRYNHVQNFLTAFKKWS